VSAVGKNCRSTIPRNVSSRAPARLPDSSKQIYKTSTLAAAPLWAGADALPGLRIQVARAITSYVHGKLGTAPAEVVVDDEYGFVIDPVAAREIRDHYVEMDRLICTGKFLGTEAEHKLRDRIAEKKKALANVVECPTGYRALEAREDGKRVESLQRKRSSQRPYKLPATEDAEEAHLIARLAVYHHTSPEAQAR
jgi:hypothetical protein